MREPVQAGASRTAEFMALFRALETVSRPRTARLFADPYAADFLGPALRAALTLSRLPGLGRIVPRWIDWRWPGARTSGVARTRLIDDAVLGALGRGVGQIAILGAGFDCRAFRLPGMERASVFEVDHPATSVVKRARLERTLGAIPAHVRFVAADLACQDLGSALTRAGFDAGACSLFLWEGVTNYLSAGAVDAVLRDIARLSGSGSTLVFTYVHSGLLDGSVEFGRSDELMALLARVREQWTFGLDPAELPQYLSDRGFELLEDLGAADYRARVMGSSAARTKGYEFYHTAFARVA
jgi:methyltransferase (TIGR00027 family)